MNEESYRRIAGLTATDELPERCERCRRAITDATRQLLTIHVADLSQNSEYAYCLCDECLDDVMAGLHEDIEEPVC